jgi:uncharacterized protein (DUF2336 family)
MAKSIERAEYISRMQTVAESVSAIDRADVAHALIVYRGFDDVTSDDIARIDNILLKLSVDKDVTVRHALIQDLMAVKKLSPDLIFSIAADIDELSMPFIANSPALDARIITVITRVGDDARKAFLVARADFPAEAIELILKEGGAKPIIALLANNNVKLTHKQYERIIGAHGDERGVIDGLVRRRDLPAYLKVMVATHVSTEMRRRININDREAAEAARRNIINAEEIGLLRIAEGTGPKELAHLVRYLVDRRQLTPSLLLRAACLGKMDVVVESLAILSGIPAARVHNLIFAKGALSLRAVHTKASLPNALFVPLRVAVDVENARLAANRPKSNDVFGRQMIEKVLTGYESLKPAQRLELLGILRSYGAPAAAALASQLMEESVKQAA